MYQKTWISILLVSFLALPVFRECCVPTVQTQMPTCPHSTEHKKNIGTCPALDGDAKIEKQIDLSAIAFQNVAALSEIAFIEPLTSRELQSERVTSSGPPISLHLHTSTLLI